MGAEMGSITPSSGRLGGVGEHRPQLTGAGPGTGRGLRGGGGAGALPPAQAPPGQLHLGQAVVAQHLHAGDGRQRPVAVGELHHLVLLGVDVEVL